MANPSVSTTTDYYTTKAGRVAIFNGNNYAEFELTCESALIAVGAWNFVASREAAAEARTADTIKRRTEGIKIIFNSVAQTYQTVIRELSRNNDLPGMWERIAKYNRARDPLYAGELRRQFRSTIFNPSKSNIIQYVNDLEWFRTALSTSNKPITEEDLLEQLLLGLPRDAK